jgi:hypothetical protein
MAFDCGYAFIFPMVTALPLEIAGLLLVTWMFGWWRPAFRYTMKTASLALSAILPNLAMGFLVTGLMALDILRMKH